MSNIVTCRVCSQPRNSNDMHTIHTDSLHDMHMQLDIEGDKIAEVDSLSLSPWRVVVKLRLPFLRSP